MKSLGYLLLIAGFLVAAYSTALDPRVTQWPLFVPMAVAAVVGVLLIKWQARGEARSEHVLSANRTELQESLANIVADLARLKQDAPSLSMTALRDALDRKLRSDLRRFADARESMVHLYGLQTYADVMSEFAAGERYVNRAWSAAADDYAAEARDCLDKASAQFDVAIRQLEAAGGGPARRGASPDLT